MGDLYFWAAANLAISGFLMSARSWPLYGLVMAPGVITTIGLWANFYSDATCTGICPSGFDIWFGPVLFFVLAVSIFFLVVATLMAVLIKRRSP